MEQPFPTTRHGFFFEMLSERRRQKSPPVGGTAHNHMQLAIFAASQGRRTFSIHRFRPPPAPALKKNKLAAQVIPGKLCLPPSARECDHPAGLALSKSPRPSSSSQISSSSCSAPVSNTRSRAGRCGLKFNASPNRQKISPMPQVPIRSRAHYAAEKAMTAHPKRR